MLAIFVGIIMEQVALQRQIEVLERRDVQGYPVIMGSHLDKPVLLCRTGHGEERARGAAKAVLEAYKPTAVLSARLAGSVPDDLRVGDLVLCERTYLCRGGALSPGPAAEADRRLLALAQQAARGAEITYTLSNSLTAAPLVAQPLDRALVRRLYPAAVVDTEGYWLMEEAGQRAIPFLAVRCALGRSFDRAPESLDLAREDGVLHPTRVAAYFLRQPGRIPGFMRLGFSVQKAARRLSEFIREFLREWSLEA